MSSQSQYELDLHDLDLPPKRKRRTGLVAYVPGWLILGLLASVLLHVALVAIFQKVPLNAIQDAFVTEPPPPQFTVARVEIDPALLEEPVPEEEPVERQTPTMDMELFEKQLEREQETSTDTTIRDLVMTPTASPVSDELLKSIEQPVQVVDTTDVEKLRREAGKAGEETINDLQDQIQREMLETTNAGPNQPTIDVAPLVESLQGSGGGGTDIVTEGFSNIDDLLRFSGGSLPPPDKPLMMPSDVLFASDSADLRPEAVTSLQKLGTLLRRHPEVNYEIEGHTDSFGSDPYNLELSRRRAESVKQWLVSNMQIAPNRIITRGFGETRLIAPATGNEFEQQINRRVEIQVKTPQSRR